MTVQSDGTGEPPACEAAFSFGVKRICLRLTCDLTLCELLNLLPFSERTQRGLPLVANGFGGCRDLPRPQAATQARQLGRKHGVDRVSLGLKAASGPV